MTDEWRVVAPAGPNHNQSLSRDGRAVSVEREVLDAGHFVKEEHPLVTTGAYGFCRNPMYLGIILIWFGISVAFASLLLLAAAALYVTPVFWFYIRAEERMMSSEFGEQFEEYQRTVGRLLPW